MDLKSKGIAWVGNIYQRFETMCQEVDSIVNQNTVRYVENQVHTVGESMKKFCDVVQDIIPPIVDPVRCDAQAVAIKGNAVVGTYIKSMIGIEEDHGRMDPIKQSFAEPSDFDVRNQSSNTFSGHHFGDTHFLLNQSTYCNPHGFPLRVTAHLTLIQGNINDICGQLFGHTRSS
ncbi:uncharacterized protein LOC110010073 [Jatropha curcas]|uniref:uncharacterized protein LOC110010073 n=1 Tax=Jatropha curcas TaxID=180498 RepID=UPI001894D811|nr:uncharacterized protein LOC110010073 [Jatropha curcas]